MMTDVLRELSSACIVVGRDLKVLHANKAARRHFGRKNQRTGELEFSDLPQVLGAKIYQVLHTGAAWDRSVTSRKIRRAPFTASASCRFSAAIPPCPVSALLTADDLTQTEQLRNLEVEAANLRLIKAMADRLAHEIGNAMVPLSTHQQLLAEKFRDPEFREVARPRAGRRRQTRLAPAQSNALSGARRAGIDRRSSPWNPSSRRPTRRRASISPAEAAQLQCENGGKPIVITGDRAALKHALAEIMLNALQANPKDAENRRATAHQPQPRRPTRTAD
jgi:hypothetical protein